MTNKACVMLTASHVEVGPVNLVAGALQQLTRLFDGEQCVCVLLVTFPAGSPEWERYQQNRTLDTESGIRSGSIHSDAAAPDKHA